MDIEIPNGDILFRYVKPEALPPGQEDIPHGLFNDPNLSCDWKKYRENPLTSFQNTIGRSEILEITVHEEIKFPKNPRGNGEIVLDWKQEVIYDPVESDTQGRPNLAHSLIRGKKRLPVQIIIAKHTKKWKP